MKMFDELSKATPTEVALTPEVANATLLASFNRTRSRRMLLKSAVAGALGATGLTVGAGTLLLSPQVTHAEAVSGSSCTIDSIKTILSVAATAERLAVTFYTNGLKEANNLGLSGASLAAIKAAQIEEQIHELFFVANGGVPITSTFSFPHGGDTFDHLDLFIETQQQLEGVFDSAFLAAIHEFAAMGQPVLARIAGQIATIESEHRALGRFIGGLVPADNWAFSPVLIPSVGAAPAIVKEAGYLSPRPGNSFAYQQVSTADEGVTFREPVAVGC